MLRSAAGAECVSAPTLITSTPDKGKRAIYRDKQNQYLFLRVTPSTKTFFWQRNVKGKQHTVTISKFPAINADQARDRASEITADYVKGTDVEAEIRADRQEMTLGRIVGRFQG